jgi:hypothetical protein
MNKSSRKAYINQRRLKLVNTLRGRLQFLVASARGRCRKSGVDFDITVDHVVELFYRQDGCCALTGEPMTFVSDLRKRFDFVPSHVSLDRIASAGGYTIGNIQLVCRYANIMKQNLSTQELVDICEKVIHTYEENARNK